MHWYLRTSVPHDVEWSSLEIILIHLLAEIQIQDYYYYHDIILSYFLRAKISVLLDFKFVQK